LNNSVSSVPGARLTGPRFHGLDTLRSLAIVAVIVFHLLDFGGDHTLPSWLEPIATYGWIGVDLFFVLSGYLIGSQLLKPYARGERPGLWAFYRNRFFRILPAYLVVLAAYYWVPKWPEFEGIGSAWRYLTFTFNLWLPDTRALPFSHVWSLCVEEHFYLLLPVIVLVLMRKPSFWKAVAVVAGIFLFGVAVRSFFLFHTLRPLDQAGESWGRQYMARIYYPSYSRLDGLLVGVVLAAVRVFRPGWWARIARRGHLLTVSAIGLVALALWLTRDRYESVTGVAAVGDVVGFPILALGLGCLLASSVSTNGVLSRWKIPGTKLIATLAFTLYLTSKELIHIVDLWFPRLHEASMWGWLAVYAGLCLVTAGALHLCVERPFLWLRDRSGAVRLLSKPMPKESVFV
jgi:peptidoglycan/LPS O-acetylase OafA/YrhL